MRRPRMKCLIWAKRESLTDHARIFVQHIIELLYQLTCWKLSYYISLPAGTSIISFLLSTNVTEQDR
jgi:hypothetical protein